MDLQGNIKEKGKNILVYSKNNEKLESKTLTIEQAINMFTPLIKATTSYVNSYIKTNHISTNLNTEYDDILQDTYMEFINIYNSYDYTKGISFNFYIKKYLLVTLLGKINNSSKKHEEESNIKNYIKKDIETNNASNTSTNEIAYLIDIKEHIRKVLTKQEKQIIKYRLGNLTQIEISNKMNLSQSKICRILKSIRLKFDAELS
ncbi:MULTISPECIES: sigma-70 family RNA polymerase sigma factor [Clostridium]|jgi:RNA polymerase sigma factor (sigma-70 family)|uniref:sigma-70 family RNA polymerase sigma factor n=1 Tax=Clostridium TaxID=1485 RepID=UPI000E81B98A|nr:sigma-70 family RNA polymerase sigma factor [Clostridium tyrobutyricum]HBG38944.1 hypothetical protein [Clostridiaceae bacterium]